MRCSTTPMDGIRRILAIAMIMQQLTPPLTASAATLSQTGRWTSATPRGSLGFSGTHVALLREPQTNAAKVFLFGESGSPQTMKFWRFFASAGGYAPPDSASRPWILRGLSRTGETASLPLANWTETKS